MNPPPAGTLEVPNETRLTCRLRGRTIAWLVGVYGAFKLAIFIAAGFIAAPFNFPRLVLQMLVVLPGLGAILAILLLRSRRFVVDASGIRVGRRHIAWTDVTSAKRQRFLGDYLLLKRRRRLPQRLWLEMYPGLPETLASHAPEGHPLRAVAIPRRLPTTLEPVSASRGRLWAGILLAATCGPLIVWSFAYSVVYESVCVERPEFNCAPSLPFERFACDHDWPDTPYLASCSTLGVRTFLRPGNTEDTQHSLEYLRRACISRFHLGKDNCVLVWSFYLDAYSRPHYVVGWSGQYEGESYTARWGDELDSVLTRAEAICATDFQDDHIEPTRRRLVHDFCEQIPKARWGVESGRAHEAELLGLCAQGRANACHLAGLVTTLGVGVPRDMARGKALLQQACDAGVTTACEDLTDGAAARLAAFIESAERISGSAPATQRVRSGVERRERP